MQPSGSKIQFGFLYSNIKLEPMGRELERGGDRERERETKKNRKRESIKLKVI